MKIKNFKQGSALATIFLGGRSGGFLREPTRQGYILYCKILNILSPFVTETQVQQPAAIKTNTREAGADMKESGLFSCAGHLEDGDLKPQSPSPHLSEGRVFIGRERGSRTKRSRKGVGKFSMSR